MAFEAVVASARSRLFLVLPFEPDTAWGAKERHHVTGTVNGRKIRGPLGGGPDGRATLQLAPAWLRDCPIREGDRVAVVLSPEGPQLDDLAPDIVAALEVNPGARAFFQALPQFYRKAYLTWLAGAARRPAERQARVDAFVALLNDGKKERPK